MTDRMTATNETLVETLWASRQFIVDHTHSGDEFAIILRIDKDLAYAARGKAA